jgi:hypothetical protein
MKEARRLLAERKAYAANHSNQSGGSYFEAYGKAKASLKPDEMSDFLQLR